MTTYNVPAAWIWGTISFIFVLIVSGVVGFIHFWKKFKTDIIIMLDKNNRWRIFYVNVKGRGSFNMGDKAYQLLPDAAILNYKGKAMYIFSENKPEPLAISFKKVEWLDAKSLSGVINNKLVQQIVKPTDKMTDTLILLGAIGGILAGLASVLILLIQTGVISTAP